MLRIREAIVVEGRYDKNTLSQLVDTLILETAGFGIFKNEEQMALLRRVAAQRGLIVLTDPDGAGFVIRNRLKGAIPQEQLKHAYVPDILGKERRKARPGKEGKLGVEGMSQTILTEALRRAGATFLEEEDSSAEPVHLTKADLMMLGFAGGADSAVRRGALLRALDLPEHISANALLQVLNTCCTQEELAAALDEIEQTNMKPTQTQRK